jgi:hypothetical protein
MHITSQVNISLFPSLEVLVESTPDDCNSYLSQCKTCVEIAFRMMVNRFHVLQSPLGVSIIHVGPMIQCILQLHNCILNKNNKYDLHQREQAQEIPLVPCNDETGQETKGNPAQPVTLLNQLLI